MTLTSVQQILGTTTHRNHHPTRTTMASTAQLVTDQQNKGKNMTMPIVILVVLQQVVVTMVVCQQCTPLHTYMQVPPSY